MARMGHSTPRAAQVYLHARVERDATLAEALGPAMRDHLTRPEARTAQQRDNLLSSAPPGTTNHVPGGHVPEPHRKQSTTIAS